MTSINAIREKLKEEPLSSRELVEKLKPPKSNSFGENTK